jgi:hypothetical protein
MKFLKVLMASVVLAANLVGAQEAMAVDAIPDGSIKFAGKEDGTDWPCSVVLTSQDYLFNKPGDDDCRNDQANYFKLDNAPSATFITLYSDSDQGKRTCQEESGVDYGWKYKLKLIKQPTTTIWIKIDDLHSMEADDIVKAGVVLVEKKEKSGDRIDELSCMKVERSPLP